jgi:hypothetical protein
MVEVPVSEVEVTSAVVVGGSAEGSRLAPQAVRTIASITSSVLIRVTLATKIGRFADSVGSRNWKLTG